MPKTSILIVDDEPDLVWAVQRSLSHAGYEVLTARDGLEALAVARRHVPALVILDINMPYLDGLEVCRQMRQDLILATVPILFLTVHNAISDQVLGLNEGGDDYLIKPFDLQVLKARIHALLRRGQSNPDSNANSNNHNSILVVGPITLNIHTRQVRIGRKMAELTPTEFDLFRFLMTHPNNVFNSEQLLKMVWNYPPETGDPCLVRWHIKNLRAKIERDPNHPVHILTVSHHGYMLKG
jgi:DNA-binding response OmpR family regulator